MSGSPQRAKRTTLSSPPPAPAAKSVPAAPKKTAPVTAKKPARRKKTAPSETNDHQAGVGWRILLAVQLVLILGALYSCTSGTKPEASQQAAARLR